MRQKRGFTLVELLVVIAIIAVLISILLPSLNKARNSAVMVQCASNLSQLGLGMIQYAQDNRDWYVPYSGQAPWNGGNVISNTNNGMCAHPLTAIQLILYENDGGGNQGTPARPSPADPNSPLNVGTNFGRLYALGYVRQFALMFDPGFPPDFAQSQLGYVNTATGPRSPNNYGEYFCLPHIGYAAASQTGGAQNAGNYQLKKIYTQAYCRTSQNPADKCVATCMSLSGTTSNMVWAHNYDGSKPQYNMLWRDGHVGGAQLSTKAYQLLGQYGLTNFSLGSWALNAPNYGGPFDDFIDILETAAQGNDIYAITPNGAAGTGPLHANARFRLPIPRD
jgi:prepilin-type N-terminal cleavage/methylation domain-containing protein